MGIARQQRLPQEVVDLKQDVQNGANTRDSSHKDSPVLNPLHGHDDESISDFHMQHHVGTFKLLELTSF